MKMPIISIAENPLNHSLEPMIFDYEERNEPPHADGDFVISADGVLKKYLGSRRHVVIPNRVSSIGIGAFQEQTIRSVTIPKSVTCVSKRAFYNCRFLDSIYFEECKALSRLQTAKLQQDNYMHYLSIEEEAFLLTAGNEIDRCILLPRHLMKIAKNAFANAKNNSFLIYPYFDAFRLLLSQEKDFDHLYPHFDEADVEKYVAEYAKRQREQASCQTDFLNNKISRIRRDSLQEAIEKKAYYEKMLSQAKGLFRAKERKMYTEWIEGQELVIARVQKEIKDLENEISALAAKSNEAIAKFETLSPTERKILVHEAFKAQFSKTAAAAKSIFLWLLDIEKRMEEHKKQILHSVNTQSTTTSRASQVSPLYDTIPYGNNAGDTFTGNQMEDYPKIREKILSGEATISDFREYEKKWDYLP
jgi:hypothetical protein